MSVVSIAQDVQGPEIARPWLVQAGATFPNLIDRHNQVGNAYNLKAVPIGILLDEHGQLVRPVGHVDINDALFRREVTDWVETGNIPAAWSDAPVVHSLRKLTDNETRSTAHLRSAVVLLTQGDRDSAIAELDQAFRLDQNNFIIRKQLWALDSPEAFYQDRVDYAWQRNRTAFEDAHGTTDPVSDSST